jgi:hypothetical protein
MTGPKEQKMYPSEFSLSLTTLENFAFALDVDVDTVGTHSASWDKKSLEYDCARVDWEAAELRFGGPWGFCYWDMRQIWFGDDEAVSKGQRRRLVAVLVVAIGLRIDQEIWMTLIGDVDKLPANAGRMVF